MPALRRKKGDREEECGGGGVGCLVFKNKEKRGEERAGWGEQTGRGGEGSGVEVRGRLAGWLGGWVAGAVAGLPLWREGHSEAK